MGQAASGSAAANGRAHFGTTQERRWQCDHLHLALVGWPQQKSDEGHGHYDDSDDSSVDLDGFGWIWGILRFWTSPEGIFLSFLCKTAKDNSNLAYIIFLF